MAEYIVQDTSLKAIADAVRAKTGSTDALTLEDMASAIGEISGGGSFKTCTINVSFQSPCYLYTYAYTSVVDGELVPAFAAYFSETTIIRDVTLENVLCGSLVRIDASGSPFIGWSVEGGVQSFGFIGVVSSGIFKAPTEAGAVGRITCYYND